MPLPPLAMSESKAAMMARLGLSGTTGEQMYRLLLDEASKGRDRLSYDPQNLTTYSQSQNPPTPYKWDELQETKRHSEILKIAQAAGPYTRQYYQMGRYIRGHEEENWVAQWFLWHCFRYRDNRPRASAPAGGPVYQVKPAQYWDPVYGVYRRAQ
ncbi:hypothetical protein P280DRAFT_468009 [Massarina eburnea CBS 473.64]|uniref:Uncharacterized protein n=1 Tax=Massarina eburnea CBS 473.64 TaxID=1395130 RepID=A0A6A6S923_9PLEO|nr:hypothetical protein P280DRAFT_468009 [Massarina eburnea CBS 473.64]